MQLKLFEIAKEPLRVKVTGTSGYAYGKEDIMEEYANLGSDVTKINKISPLTLRNFAYLVDMRFSSVTQMPSALRISAVPLSAMLKEMELLILDRTTKEKETFTMMVVVPFIDQNWVSPSNRKSHSEGGEP